VAPLVFAWRVIMAIIAYPCLVAENIFILGFPLVWAARHNGSQTVREAGMAGINHENSW
jgi:hypothetical protein